MSTDHNSQNEQRVRYYLDSLRAGDSENAFHGLIEIGHGAIPILIAEYESEISPKARALLIEIISYFRQPDTVPFLSNTLQDLNPIVWKAALDGLVSIGSQEALHELEAAMKRQFPAEEDATNFRRWILEAIQQVRGE